MAEGWGMEAEEVDLFESESNLVYTANFSIARVT